MKSLHRMQMKTVVGGRAGPCGDGRDDGGEAVMLPTVPGRADLAVDLHGSAHGSAGFATEVAANFAMAPLLPPTAAVPKEIGFPTYRAGERIG